MAYMGLPVADDLDGRVLTELFEPNELVEIERCRSYEDGTGPFSDHRAGESLEERLKVLGYVE
jgi:hypothetical protein